MGSAFSASKDATKLREWLAAHLQPGTRVAVHGAAAEPLSLIATLREHPELSRGVHYFQTALPALNPHAYADFHPEAEASTFFITPPMRSAFRAGKLHFYPFHLHHNAHFFSEKAPPQVVLLQLSLPDARGLCSLGVTADYPPDWLALSPRPLIVAQLNPNMPRTQGYPQLPYAEISFAIEADHPLPTMPAPHIDAVAAKIGERVASLVEDGDVIQVGLGRIPDAVLNSLRNHKHLGFHAGLFTDAVMQLILCGALDGQKKSIDREQHVCGAVVGSKALYEFVDRNPAIALKPVRYTHAQEVLAQLDGLVAINAALEVDLLGQCNAEMIDGQQRGGIGGQVDFVRGARAARGGKAILAFPSTTSGGDRSRIVPRLSPGSAVGTTRADVDHVITEHGIASLRHLDLDQRAEALIAVAAPAFREQLEGTWQTMRRAM